MTAPFEDELEFFCGKNEHSAMEHAYWEKKIFLDVTIQKALRMEAVVSRDGLRTLETKTNLGLDDPETLAGESGRI